MPDSLARRQPAEIVLPQPTNGSVQFTQLQLETLEHLVEIGLVSYERVYRDTEAYLENGKGGRSIHHQQYMEGCGAMLLHLHNWTAERILGKAASDILANKPQPEQVVTRIIEAPRRGIIHRLFGG